MKVLRNKVPGTDRAYPVSPRLPQGPAADMLQRFRSFQKPGLDTVMRAQRLHGGFYEPVFEAVNGGKTVGSAEYVMKRGEGALHLANIFVLDGNRCLGIGKHLMAQLLEKTYNAGLAKLTLDCRLDEEHEAALEFYRSIEDKMELSLTLTPHRYKNDWIWHEYTLPYTRQVDPSIEILRHPAMLPSVVIWDWDRTIFDPGEVIGGEVHYELISDIMGRAAGAPAMKFYKDAVSYFQNSQGMINLTRFQSLVEELGVTHLSPETYDDICTARVQQYVRSHIDGWMADPENCFIKGSRELARYFRELGMEQYLVTGNSWLMEHHVEEFGLAGIFNKVYGAASRHQIMDFTKPAANEAISAGHPRDHILIISDGTKDIENGNDLRRRHNSDVMTIGLAHPQKEGSSSPGEAKLRALHPNVLLHGGSFPDAVELTEVLFG